MNESLTQTPARRGRPVGSFSFVSVRMEDLASIVGPHGHVTVSAKFAEQLGIKLTGAKASVIHRKSVPTEGAVEIRPVLPKADFCC